MRRNAVRRNRTVLDEEQTKDAVKVLQKYAQQKYRNSVLVSTNDLEAVSENLSPILGRRLSTSRQQTTDRHSTLFTSKPSPISDRPPLSPACTADFITDHSVREEIKREQKETWCAYFLRISKYFYYYLGLKYLLMTWIILGYGLLGGYLFMIVELPNEKQEESQLQEITKLAASKYATILSKQIVEHNCSYSKEYHREKCDKVITETLRMFHNELANDVNAPWKWNYWNAVFYAATIFTTIGYGNLTCKTTYGRLITIVYGTIGIPLMLLALKIIGEGILIYFQKAWNNFKRKMRHFKRCWVRSWKMRRTNTIESVSTMDILTGERIEEEPEPDVIFSTIPLTLVLLFVILFMILCSIIVSFWEQWDYFTSFYFFFVSLSTIGFGDIIPQHPKYACLLFGLYFIGLALFSMVYAILQERVENKYMWALTLIDQMYSEPQQTCEVEAPPTVEAKIFLDQSKDEDFEKPKRLLSYQFEPQTSVRFRNRFASESQESVSVDRPSSEYRFSVLLTPGETPKPLPPALGALMAFRSSLKNKQLVRSDSSLSKLTQSSKREFGNTPSVSENLTPNEMSLSAPPPWNILDASLASPALTTLGSAQGAASTPSLVGRLAPLSVIAEVSDEDSLLTKHSSKRKGIHQLVRLEAVKSEVGTSSDLKSPSQDSLPDDKFMEELNITEESPCSLPSVDPERLQVPEGSSQPLPNKLRRLPAQDIPSPSLNPDSPSQIPLLSIQRPSEITEEE